jgi:hypothetical protein
LFWRIALGRNEGIMNNPWATIRRFFGGPASGERRVGGIEGRCCKVMKKMEPRAASFSEETLSSPLDMSIETVTYIEQKFVLRFGEKTLLQWRAMFPVGSQFLASRLMDEELVEALDGIFGGHEVLRGDDIKVNSDVLKFWGGEFVPDEYLSKSPIPPAILTYKIGSQEMTLMEACRRNPKFAVETIQGLWDLFVVVWKEPSKVPKPRKLGIDDADNSGY